MTDQNAVDVIKFTGLDQGTMTNDARYQQMVKDDLAKMFPYAMGLLLITLSSIAYLVAITF